MHSLCFPNSHFPAPVMATPFDVTSRFSQYDITNVSRLFCPDLSWIFSTCLEQYLKIQKCHVLWPTGGAMTVTKYLEENVFRARVWLISVSSVQIGPFLAKLYQFYVSRRNIKLCRTIRSTRFDDPSPFSQYSITKVLRPSWPDLRWIWWKCLEQYLQV